MLPENWKCSQCKLDRIPDVRIVRKNKKCWIIYTCRICKLKDIDTYTPAKLWNGWKFIDEVVIDEDEENP